MRFHNVENCIVSNNEVQGGECGLIALKSQGLTIKYNQITPDIPEVSDSTLYGIHLVGVADSKIVGNTVTGKLMFGIDISSSPALETLLIIRSSKTP